MSGNASISGDLTVLGTTTMDNTVIINTTIDGTLTVGVDDTGYDVEFFGATTGKSLLWDESADSLIVTGTTTLVGTTNLDVVDIDGATQIDATVTVGVDDTGYDVKFFGATTGKSLLWDESADSLTVAGNLSVSGGTIKLDGNYPVGTGNVALGDTALDDGLLIGNYNTALGFGVLTVNSTGGGNTGIGSLALNAATTGGNNTAVGWQASRYMTTASNTTAIGYLAGGGFGGATVMTGDNNTLVGATAGLKTTSGNNIVAVGYSALTANTTGASNVAVGTSALTANTAGINNTAVGYQAGYSNTYGNFHTFIGFNAGYSASSAILARLTAVGAYSLYNNTGSRSVAVGFSSLILSTTGDDNTACGFESLKNIILGSNNTAVGSGSGRLITTGEKNTILGRYDGNQGGLDIRTSSNNIVLSDGDGNPRVVVNSSGNVGIGNISPATALDVTGTTTLVNLDVSGAVDIAGDLTLSAGGDGALRFTAASSVKVLDNDAAALVFEEADNAYMTFVTTDGFEAVKFDKALDINAATQIDATVTVGVDDTGYDVKFFGATAGAYMLWDESADDLILGGAAGLSVNSTALVTGVLTTTAATVFNGGFAAGGVGTFADGSNSAPSLTNTGDLNTGLYFPAADEVGLTVGGTQRLNVSATGIDVTGTVVADGLTLGVYDGFFVSTPLNVKSDASHFGLSIQENSGNESWQIGVNANGDLSFHNSADATPSVRFDDAGNVDISGDIDVDGTTNLDVVDIDGATQIDATVTVGVDDTGYDVKFFGATAGAYMLWDESADTLEVSGTITVDGSVSITDTVDAKLSLSGPLSSIDMYDTDSVNSGTRFESYSSGLLIKSLNDDGTATQHIIELNCSNGNIIFFDNTSTEGVHWNAATKRLGIGTTSAATALDVNGTITATTLTQTSSLRYKNTVNDATHGLTELMTLRPVTYKGNNDGDTVFGGLIAEEVHDAGLTEFVQYNDDGAPNALAYSNMVSLCIKAIQEQQATILALTARITVLEGAK